ncbi:Neutral/alkaline non-lysosomal ceramidase [Aquisphaera giovannonii]|uniref:Neutral/alkaline non-lysosomal ceramidase n=1 Tax=Aquisphaera giovannonii TaxID=406548 RepID=A0A5B9W9K3_9BACT|nr:hypothetical protein [Aquisphaera giovannonii]QEH36919.1 Neutral/alkaline non-lysosomal ceramidase [Aquisphaera giovannonii]
MRKRRVRCGAAVLVLPVAMGLIACRVLPADEPKGRAHGLRAGLADRDITPDRRVPMWGYGARHDRLSEGVLDRLKARALVIRAGDVAIAIVALDLGRGPTPGMMARIRSAARSRGIGHVLVCGSHTHHGPVIELTDAPGAGKGKFDDAVAYAKQLPDRISEAILEADGRCTPARIGWAWRDLNLNRNRQTKRPEKPTDPRLTVIRLDGEDGSTIATIVHFTAHPVLTPEDLYQFSADYPGYLRARVEEATHAPSLFLQGAAGDQSANPPPGVRGARAYGERLADEAIGLARGIVPAGPKAPTLAVAEDRFRFASRVNFKGAMTFLAYSRAFFPELVRNFFREMEDGIDAEMTTAVIGSELALVGIPGEPFSQHAVRLRQRSYLPCTLVLGYCNGHVLYLPTIEAVSEGGYGADAQVSPAAIGAGEAMMDRALIRIYTLVGKLPAGTPSVEPARDAGGAAR